MKWINKHVWLMQTFIFLAILIKIFFNISYLFRPISRYRSNIVGFYAEKSNTLDIVLIGGSSVYVFWAPYEAWNDHGITSYDLSTDAMSPALLKGLLEESSKTQKPQLYVIDLRALEIRDISENYFSEPYLRMVTDSMRYSHTRTETIRYAFEYEMPTNKYNLSNYFDICMYHTNWNTLSMDNFLYAENNIENEFKGFKMITTALHQRLEKTDFSYITHEIPLSEESDQILQELLEYCQEKNFNVLFTYSPMLRNSESQKARCNYIERIVNTYGFAFIDSNDYYTEMALDFDHDFYNEDHVNLYGALKYTKFLSSYIIENYDMPDHRDDIAYNTWNNGYILWHAAVTEQKNLIEEYIAQEQLTDKKQ